MSRFTGRQITSMVIAGCAVLVLLPPAVGAATGQIVNIVDSVNAGRTASVNGAHALIVEQRAGVPSGSINAAKIGGTSTTYNHLYQWSANYSLALTQITLSNNQDAVAHLAIVQYVRTSGAGTCAGLQTGTTTGFTSPGLMRIVYVPAKTTLALNFNGPAMRTSVAPSGNFGCFGVWPLSTSPNFDSFATGYIFTA
jgi:hypothetical protein